MKLNLNPTFGPGTGIEHVLVNGEQRTFDRVQTPHYVQPRITVDIKDRYTDIVFKLTPCVEILPPENTTFPGAADRGLKLISVEKHAEQLIVECEGLAGHTYHLGVTHADLILDVIGAELDFEAIRLSFPTNGSSGFVRQKIRIVTR
jgi:hypothetical protein